MPKTEAIAEQNDVEVPLYTYLDVARYLRIPLWASLPLSGQFHPEEMFKYFLHGPIIFAQNLDDYAPPFRDDESRRISFRTLANLFILSFLFRIPPLREPLSHWRHKDGRFLFNKTWEAFRHAESEPNLFVEPDPDTILDQFGRYVIRGGVRQK